MSNRVLIAVTLALALGLAGGIYASKTTGGFFNVRQIVSDNGILRVSADDLPGLRLKAEGGEAKAQTILGIMYAFGRAVPLDYTKAIYWLEKAAIQGNETAQYHLAGMYKDGRGVPRDFEKSVYWMKKAAEQGHFRAPYFLAMAYEKGRGVPKSARLADKWYRKAAEAAMEAEKGKHAEAARQLAFLYMEGNGGLPLDEQLAVEWMQKAAERGDPVAQRVLPNFEKAAELAETARNTLWVADGKPEKTLHALEVRLSDELTPPEILELFKALTKHGFSSVADKYEESQYAHRVEFLDVLTAHVKSRDPVADVDRGLGSNVSDVYVLHGKRYKVYEDTSRILLPAFTTGPAPPDKYHNPGVVCIGGRKVLHGLRYGKYAVGDKYKAEQEFISALDNYVVAYNTAMVEHPDYPHPYWCQKVEEGTSEQEVESKRGVVQVAPEFWLSRDFNTNSALQKSTPYLAAHFDHADLFGSKFGVETLNEPDELGHLPAFYAVKAGQVDVLVKMLDMGMDTEKASKSGNITFLHIAARFNRPDIASTLLNHGADKNAKGYRRRTALAIAVEYGHDAVIDVLLDHGVDVNLPEAGSNKTPLYLAVKQGRAKLVAKLLAHGADATFADLLAAARNGDLDISRQLYAAGAKPNTWNWKSRNKPSLLREAIISENFELVSFLLERGTNPNGYWGDDTSALRAALGMGNLALAGRLVEAGADVSLLDPKMYWSAPAIRWVMKNAPDAVFPPGTIELLKEAERLAGDKGLEEAAQNLDMLQLADKADLSTWRKFLSQGKVTDNSFGGETRKNAKTAEDICSVVQDEFWDKKRAIQKSGDIEAFKELTGKVKDINDLLVAREIFVAALSGGQNKLARHMLDLGFLPHKAYDRFSSRYARSAIFIKAIWSGDRAIMQRIYDVSVKGRAFEAPYLYEAAIMAQKRLKRRNDDTALRFLEGVGLEIPVDNGTKEIVYPDTDGPFFRELLLRSQPGSAD